MALARFAWISADVVPSTRAISARAERMARTERARGGLAIFVGSGRTTASGLAPPPSAFLQKWGFARSQPTSAAYAAPPTARMGHDPSAAAHTSALPATPRLV